MSSTIRAPSMDLLRALAILMVMVAHSVLNLGVPENLAGLQYGGTGVDLFFVLSGWLLGGQLFKEFSREGSIDVRRFWVRRWLRTLPAYYAVLILSTAQRLLTKDGAEFPVSYYVFLQNYEHPLYFFSVSWSLCVEEHFYLFVAPTLLLLFSRLRAVVGMTALVALLLLPFIFRELAWYETLHETHVRWDGCLMGVLLAGIRSLLPHLWTRLCGIAPYLAVMGLSVYVLAYVSRWLPEIGLANPNLLILSLIFGSFVLVANASESWQRRLYIPGANYIATRAYALYLLHPEALAVLRRLDPEVPFLVYFVLVLAISCVAAEILYRIVEKPIMDARENFGFSKSRA
jgi:peptidoglycan/LPS O-acetylase OafA/YrhL